MKLLIHSHLSTILGERDETLLPHRICGRNIFQFSRKFTFNRCKLWAPVLHTTTATDWLKETLKLEIIFSKFKSYLLFYSIFHAGWKKKCLKCFSNSVSAFLMLNPSAVMKIKILQKIYPLSPPPKKKKKI